MKRQLSLRFMIAGQEQRFPFTPITSCVHSADGSGCWPRYEVHISGVEGAVTVFCAGDATCRRLDTYLNSGVAEELSVRQDIVGLQFERYPSGYPNQIPRTIYYEHAVPVDGVGSFIRSYQPHVLIRSALGILPAAARQGQYIHRISYERLDSVAKHGKKIVISTTQNDGPHQVTIHATDEAHAGRLMCNASNRWLHTLEPNDTVRAIIVDRCKEGSAVFIYGFDNLEASEQQKLTDAGAIAEVYEGVSRHAIPANRANDWRAAELKSEQERRRGQREAATE